MAAESMLELRSNIGRSINTSATIILPQTAMAMLHVPNLCKVTAQRCSQGISSLLSSPCALRERL